MSEEVKLGSPTGGPRGLPPVPLFAWVRSRWFLRWHITHLAWVASAIPLLGFAGWKAIVESDAGWNIFIFGWMVAGVWLRVDRYLEARTAEVARELDEKLSTAEANSKIFGITPFKT